MQTTAISLSWTAPDGELFAYSEWRPVDGAPLAVVVAIHGLSGAAIDFEPLGSFLAQQGMITVAPELRGQGNDPKPSRRGDLESIDDWFRDLAAFLALTRRRHPGLPLFYYGESMGGAILTRYTAQAEPEEQPAGLILASPVVILASKPTWWQEQVFRFFLLVRPAHRVDVRKWSKPKPNEPPKWVTRDEAHRRWFETASHKLDCFTVRFFKCLFDLISGCYGAAPKIDVPVLVLYAAQDVFITPQKVEEFFERLGSAEKERQLYPDSYHLLLHDYDKAQVLARIGDWLEKRVNARG